MKNKKVVLYLPNLKPVCGNFRTSEVWAKRLAIRAVPLAMWTKTSLFSVIETMLTSWLKSSLSGNELRRWNAIKQDKGNRGT